MKKWFWEIHKIYINREKAELDLAEHLGKTGEYHIDCCCASCKAIDKWFDLPVSKRLLFKLCFPIYINVDY